LHAQHELFLYGSPLTTLMFPLWVRYWAKRLPTVVTIHGVFGPDQIGASLIGSRAPAFLTGPIRKVIGWVFSTIAKADVLKVVHEPTLRKRLIAFGASPDSVFVIPHPSFDASLYARPVKGEARRRLRIDAAAQVVLSWGFLNTYKGFDVLLDGFEQFKTAHPNAVLVLGAGKHPKLIGNRAYEAQYEDLRRRAEAIGGVRFAGFIADEDVPDYIAAADVAVFPYTQYLAASGPVSHAVGFGVPVLLSDAFADAPEALKFQPTGSAIAQKLGEFFGNPQRFAQAASEMGSAMSDAQMRAAYAGLYARAAGSA
jgi:glycosyltransferase involved in cell wall biosynthesis